MLPSPEKIGPYTITGQIGAGGMATVYRAVHPKNGRTVALKVLADHLADQDAGRRRFEREAQTLLQFRHPHILPVYDYGSDGDTPYLVMRLLPGRSLADLLRGQPLPLSEIGRYTRQIASALDYAHARGIVHRDVKPDNILLDDAGIPYLADFGVAAFTSGPHVDTPGARLTDAGGFVGTVAYAAPEQYEGKSPDRPGDVYSLAVMVFEMATGRLPFEASSSLAVMKMHLRDSPPNPLAYNPHLPMGLYIVLAKALAKLPENRYPSAMKFSEAVDEALGLRTQPDLTNEDDWLYGNIQPVSPEGPAAWTIFAGQTPPDPVDDPPALPEFDFDDSVDYGRTDPFADLELEAVVAGFSDPIFDDEFDPVRDDLPVGDFTDDFSDEAVIDLTDPFPPPTLILGHTPPFSTPAATASPLVIRPLRPPPAHVARSTLVAPPSIRTHRTALALLASILLAAGVLTVYIVERDEPESPRAIYRSERLAVSFEYPEQWHDTSTELAVLSSVAVPTVLLSDQPVAPGDYTGASVVIAIQPIDPVDVFGVPPDCMPRIPDGPASTFACMEDRGFNTPVYRLFATPRDEGSVHLPGTLPPTRASLPVILLPDGPDHWLALIIVHGDDRRGVQSTLARIARSVRPL